MIKIYYWLLMTILSSVIGTAFAAWFEKTAVGIWVNNKIYSILDWAVARYNLEILKTESKFEKQYPTILARIQELEKHHKGK